jgi:hypothetical protein
MHIILDVVYMKCVEIPSKFMELRDKVLHRCNQQVDCCSPNHSSDKYKSFQGWCNVCMPYIVVYDSHLAD